MPAAADFFCGWRGFLTRASAPTEYIPALHVYAVPGRLAVALNAGWASGHIHATGRKPNVARTKGPRDIRKPYSATQGEVTMTRQPPIMQPLESRMLFAVN